MDTWIWLVSYKLLVVRTIVFKRQAGKSLDAVTAKQQQQ
jgi:hypothetical protein